LLYLPKINTFIKANGKLEDYTFTHNFYEYIIKNQKSKNLIFLNRPITIEDFAKELCKYSDVDNINGVNEIAEFVGEQYYICDVIKKGIIYIHSQMPDVVKSYLLYLYKSNKNIKYLVTNSSVLEGVNTPSDILFIGDYIIGQEVMSPMDFINLRGRINRIADIVFNQDLSRLKCDIHFDVMSETRIRTIKNRIIDPCYNDKRDSKILNAFINDNEDNVSNINYNYSLNKIKTINNDFNASQFKNYKPLDDINNLYIKNCLLNDVVLNPEQRYTLIDKLTTYCNQNINNIENLLLCIIDMFSISDSDDIELSRMRNVNARKFYSLLLNWMIENKNIKEKASLMTSHYKKFQSSLIYIGKSRGEVCAELVDGILLENLSGYSVYKDENGIAKKLEKVWIINNKSDTELYNISIVKIKVEEILFRLN
jgi:hypothetical protein